MGSAKAYLLSKSMVKMFMQENADFMESMLQARDDSCRSLIELFVSSAILRPEIRLARILLSIHRIFNGGTSPEIGYAEIRLSDLEALCTIAQWNYNRWQSDQPKSDRSIFSRV